MKKYLLLIGFILPILQIQAQTVTDVDGNVYNTVTIGTQIWMKENLRVTKYSNGDPIPTTLTANQIVGTETFPKYQWAYNADESYVATLGRLYTWYVATDSRNVCPTNWHLPTKAEWTILANFLTNNGYGYEGSGDDIAKAVATPSGWSLDGTLGNVGNDQSSNNSSGFSLPAAGRRGSASFSGIGFLTRVWGADLTSMDGIDYGYVFCLVNNFSKKMPGLGDNPKDGYSIRCLKNDNSVEQITVAFNVDGGSTVPIFTTIKNSTITRPTDPTKSGYTFSEWYKEAACTNVWDFATDVVTANTTLFAKWTINTYTVSFSTDGGSAVESVTTNYNTFIAVPATPTKSGYTFGGWYKEIACANVWSFDSDIVTANITLFAKWSISTFTEKKQVGDFKFYPNPAKDKLYIKDSNLPDAIVMIYDLKGKQVINTTLGLNPIDISNLSKGVYVVKIIDSKNTMINKLIKE